ncbi:MAG TPA: hypothetical protein VMH83_06810 [Candidatus Acidoferrum sp.]|nr:hypothetical protein [Candidatus Acidoferrum sp.]
MKKLAMVIAAFCALLCFQAANAQAYYQLHRTTIVYTSGSKLDTGSTGTTWTVSGTMTITGSRVVQSLKLCQNVINCVSAALSATVTSIDANDTDVQMKTDAGGGVEFALLSLNPLMTMGVSTASTEVDQWMPATGQASALSNGDEEVIDLNQAGYRAGGAIAAMVDLLSKRTVQ